MLSKVSKRIVSTAILVPIVTPIVLLFTSGYFVLFLFDKLLDWALDESI